MRCDLHVHTLYSGPVGLPVLRRFGRECYSTPREVYDTARRRGMDLVTITDHDTIDGALTLASLPDFFISEEVTLQIEGGRIFHLGVFDIGVRHHEAIQRRRRDAEALLAYLAEERIPFCVNHLFSPLTGRRLAEDFALLLNRAPLVEALNGMMPAISNRFAHGAGRFHKLGAVGGSDAHALGSVARAFTTVPRAADREEFLAGLRAGMTVPAGASGSYARLVSDISVVFAGALVENLRLASGSGRAALRCAGTLLLLPVLPLVPLIGLLSYMREELGARRNARLYQACLERATSPRPCIAVPEAQG